MIKDLVKNYNFSEESLNSLNEINVDTIENYFSDQELINIPKENIVKASTLLEPVLGKIEIVNFFDYITNLKKDQAKAIPPTKNEKGDVGETGSEGMEESEDETQIDLYIKNQNLLQQIWSLEYLINNSSLLEKPEDIEIVTKKLREKELELNIYNLLLEKFFECLTATKNIHSVLNFKPFEGIKKDLAKFILMIKEEAPIDTKSFIELFRKRGFEEGYSINVKLCLALADLILDPKIKRILTQASKDFPKLNFDTEKKRFIRKTFSESDAS